MDFEAQDSTKLIILMIAGAAFAVAGLWLLIKPKPSGSTAKIEFFGLKFESSSAGLLVFLIGAAFLVIPLFVPEKQGAAPREPMARSPVKDGARPQPVVLPATPDPKTAAVEPVGNAVQLAIGVIMSGKVWGSDDDWYRVSTAGQSGKRLVVGLRLVTGDSVIARLYNADSVQMADTGFVDAGEKFAQIETTGAMVYVQVSTDTPYGQTYEIFSRLEDY